MNFPNRRGPGHVQVELGTAQRWVITTLVTVLLAGGGIAAKAWVDWAARADQQLTMVMTQNATISAQITAQSVLLAAVPEMQRQIAVNIGAIQRLNDDVRELKARRGR
jgi:hypothetical protein